MTSRNRSLAGVTLTICAAILLAGAGFARAGDLNPPAGSVVKTMKTLVEVEPRTAINATNTPGDADSLFKITLPGSYYLTGNITGVAAKHGIEIAVSGVTLDLNGFDLLGVAGSLDGVSATVDSLRNIAVVDGSVRNWGDEGVDLGTLFAINCRVADLLASGNTGNGISTGHACTVSNCSAFNNIVSGISTTNDCTVTNCSANVNIVNGITTTDGCTITGCAAIGNGITGISTGEGCTVTNCSANVNILNGISTNTGCTVSNCTAYQNAASGISVSNGSTVADCTARINTLDGIRCSSQCIIRGDTCSSNGNGGDGANIHATASANRIEGNNCTFADRGIGVDSFGNIIIKNTCAGNTIDWVIALNNVFGPIIDRRAPASAAVSGFTAASSLGSTDANANFSY